MDLNDDQSIAFNAIINERKNVYLCGPAGTGKTYLLKYIVEEFVKRGMRGLVTATTGKAQKNLGIEKATTLHTALQWRSGKADVSFNNVLAQRDKDGNIGVKIAMNICEEVDYIIVEEVSMLSDIHFDMFMQQLHFKQYVKNMLNEKQKIMLENIDDYSYQFVEVQKLFSKISRDMKENFREYTAPPQIILVGDLRQLEPIKGNYFIKSKLYNQCCFQQIELTIAQRQKDPAFLNILGLIRKNEMLAPSVKQFLRDIVEKRNIDDETLHVFTKVASVDAFNQSKTKGLRSQKSIQYQPKLEWKIEQEQRNYEMKKLAPSTDKQTFFVGMRVLLVKNIKEDELVNGDLGTIKSFHSATVTKTKRDNTRITFQVIEITVAFDDHKQEKIIQQQDEQQYYPVQYHDEEEPVTRPIFTFTSVPLMSAYGFTVHKIQGASLPKLTIHIDENNPIFSIGQFYTMISRATNTQNLYLDIGTQNFETFYDKLCQTQAKKCKYPECITQKQIRWNLLDDENLKSQLVQFHQEEDPWNSLRKQTMWSPHVADQTLRRKIIKIRNEILNSTIEQRMKNLSCSESENVKIMQTIRKIIGESSRNSVETNGVECPKCSKRLSANHLMQIGIYCECEATKMEICQQIINKYPWFTYILQDKRYTSLSQPVRYIGIATTKNRIKQSEKIRELDNSNDIVRVSLNVGETDMIRMIKTNGDKQNKQLMGNAEYSNHFRDLSKKDRQEASIVPMKTDYVVNVAFTKIFKKVFDSRVIESYNSGDLIRGNKALHCHDTMPKSCYRSEIVICYCERKCGYTSMKNKLMEREPYWGIPSNEIKKYWNKSKTGADHLHTLTKTKTNIAMIKKKERIKAIYNHDSYVYDSHGNNNIAMCLSLLKHQIKMAIMWRNGNIDEVKTINENPKGTQILGMMNLAMIKEQVKLKSNYFII